VQIADSSCPAAAGGPQAAGTTSSENDGAQPSTGAQPQGSTQASTPKTTNGRSSLGYRINFAHSTSGRKTSTHTLASVSAASARGLKIFRVR